MEDYFCVLFLVLIGVKHCTFEIQYISISAFIFECLKTYDVLWCYLEYIECYPE